MLARITKPFAAGWDEWTQRSHDPGNSYTSQDSIDGKAFKPQWVGDFRPGLSYSAVTIAGGREFIASLEYPDALEQTPYLQAIDAFTGVELWARAGKKALPLSRPASLYSNRENCSDISVAGDLLYLLGGKPQCCAFSVENGETKQSFPIPPEAKAEENDAWLYLSVSGDTLLGAACASAAGRRSTGTACTTAGSAAQSLHSIEYRKLPACQSRQATCLRYDGSTPRRPASVRSASAAARYTSATRISNSTRSASKTARNSGTPICLTRPTPRSPVASTIRRNSGRSTIRPRRTRITDTICWASTLAVKGRNNRLLDVYSPRDGSHLFNCDFGTAIAGFSFSGNFVIGSHQHGVSEAGSQGLTICDLATGELRWTEPGMAKVRCTPTLCTPNLILRRGPGVNQVIDATFLGTNLLAPTVTSFTGFRSSCTYPAVPAYNMLFVQGEGCACQSPIRGNLALSLGTLGCPSDKIERLTKGKAYGATIKEDDASWPCARADLCRGGRTSEKPAAALYRSGPAVRASRPVRLSPCPQPGETLDYESVRRRYQHVYFGSSDHCVYALNAATGKQAWRFICEGGVQVSPFLWKGRVYALRTTAAGCIASTRKTAKKSGISTPPWESNSGLRYERPIPRWPVMSGVVVSGETAYSSAPGFSRMII